jgi:NAD(P)-dependent dehydrogenase (short-subunit alcohol dehydrogenase family)
VAAGHPTGKYHLGMEQTFTEHTAVVTGAASGIGLTVAQHFADRGARVIAIDRSPDVFTTTEALAGTGHHAIAKDLLAPNAASEAIAEAVEVAGAPHILVNSAGVALLAPATEITAVAWNTTIDINLSASFFMAQAIGRVMVEAGYGRIINLASQASVIGLEEHVAYCASKAGLLGMTRVLSMEWAKHGVTVNSVSPTVVETPLGKKAWDNEKGDKLKQLIPVGRFAQPEEIASLIAYLAGRDAAMITGENILIDGGYSSI